MHCQATVASARRDHLKGAPGFRGGPHHDTAHAVLPGIEPEDRITAIGHEHLGHYLRAADGHYDWVPEPISS